MVIKDFLRYNFTITKFDIPISRLTSTPIICTLNIYDPNKETYLTYYKTFAYQNINDQQMFYIGEIDSKVDKFVRYVFSLDYSILSDELIEVSLTTYEDDYTLVYPCTLEKVNFTKDEMIDWIYNQIIEAKELLQRRSENV